MEEFKNVPFDILDVDDNRFDGDFYKFRIAVKDRAFLRGGLVDVGFYISMAAYVCSTPFSFSQTQFGVCMDQGEPLV